MNVQEVRERAVAIGLAGIGKLNKADLIRKIQQTEGNDPCFGAGWSQQCAEMHCCWRSDCQKG